MKLEVTITKRALIIVAFLFVVVGSMFVYAVTPNPGHDANTIGDGTNGQVFGGTSTFAGGATSWYAFPGHLGIGQRSIHTAYGANLFINMSGPWAGIGISSSGYSGAEGDTYIDLMKNGSIKGNINLKYDSDTGYERLEINAHPGAANTPLTIVTPHYLNLRGRSSTGAASPAIRFSETGSNSDWHIIKRGSQYTTPAERDGLLFSYWDGAAWATPLFMNKSTVCINGDCATRWQPQIIRLTESCLGGSSYNFPAQVGFIPRALQVNYRTGPWTENIVLMPGDASQGFTLYDAIRFNSGYTSSGLFTFDATVPGYCDGIITIVALP